MIEKPLVSIICPIYNEEGFIARCIDSILLQDYPQDKIELFLVDGRSEDNTREIVSSYAKKYNYIHLLDNPDKIVPPALNKGIQESKGEVVIRIDGHCIYPSNYISILVHYLYKLNASNVGAVWNTIPARDTSLCKSIAIAVSHKFGIGDSLHKVGAKSIVQTDTVPYGCFRREVFEKIGLFDNDLIRNQDDEFNGRIIKNGGKIFLIPELVIDYYARENIKKMAKMFYQYGLFKPLVNKKLGAPATIRQFFPLLFLLGIIIGGAWSFFTPMIRNIYCSVLIIYFLLSFFFSLKEVIKNKDIKILFYLPILFPIIHLSYGWGYLKGLIKIIRKKSFQVQTSR